jgi:rhodanese-related sulfurtransferase
MSEQKAEAQPISDIKDKIEDVLPSAPDATPVSSAQALKERLEWGKPALTIIDIRDRESFLEERITGAMLMEDVDINDFAKNRDIYVYGESNEKTAQAANKLREAGCESVSQLQGGLAGWKAVLGPTEGRAS